MESEVDRVIDISSFFLFFATQDKFNEHQRAWHRMEVTVATNANI